MSQWNTFLKPREVSSSKRSYREQRGERIESLHNNSTSDKNLLTVLRNPPEFPLDFLITSHHDFPNSFLKIKYLWYNFYNKYLKKQNTSAIHIINVQTVYSYLLRPCLI